MSEESKNYRVLQKNKAAYVSVRPWHLHRHHYQSIVSQHLRVLKNKIPNEKSVEQVIKNQISSGQADLSAHSADSIELDEIWGLSESKEQTQTLNNS